MSERVRFVLCVVAIAIVPGLLAAGADVWFLSSRVIAPTMLVATAFSYLLIRGTAVASLSVWLLAGLLIPVLSVICFFAANFAIDWIVTGERYWDSQIWLAVFFGSVVAVPFGLAGVLVLRPIARRRLTTRDVGA